MAEVHWHDICDSLDLNVTPKNRRETVRIFYAALARHTEVGCDFKVKFIGRFKGSKKGARIERGKKEFSANRMKVRYNHRWTKKRQRLWAKELFDKNWTD